MRRITLVLTVAVVMTAMLGMWSGTAGAQTTVDQDSAQGEGVSDRGESFSFTATAGPEGENATGTMTYQGAWDTVQAEVNCLSVVGNGAYIRGRIVASTSPPDTTLGIGNGAEFFVKDNGSPGAGQDQFIALVGSLKSGSCQDDLSNLAGPIRAGEIVVVDGNAGPPPPPPPPPDRDSDGVANDADNCPDAVNPDQIDSDGDGKGDACDPDKDGDGASNETDNCPDAANEDQKDADGDGQGDVCDEDRDGDGVSNGSDNCPDAANPDQRDTDGDGTGDECDATPGSTPGCEVEGKGSLSTNPKARFDLAAALERGETRPEGEVRYSDKAAGLRFASTRITSVIAHDSQATIRGEGRANGETVDFRVDVEDLSGDGRRDTFRIQLSNSYTATGAMRNGDIEIECDSGDEDDPEKDDGQE